jgi:putative tricarboxylic transport membrane protein
MATVKKRPGQALLTSNIASFIGGLIGMIVLTFMGPALANVGLKFGPVEMTTLLLVAMTSIGWLLGENPTKGVLLTMFGILVASIGMDTLTGSPRYEFGSVYLLGGIPFTPFVIGVVGFSQVILLMEERNVTAKLVTDKLTIRGSMVTGHDVKRMMMPSVRAGVLGTFVGVLPGAGATAASIMAYSAQKSFKNEEPLGTGAIEGLAACESANNAAAAGAFAPLLALGIPGSGTGAVLLGGLMMWGLNPGPLLFTNSPDFAWGLIASLFLANFLALAISWGVIPFLIRILSVPTKLLIPCITVVCVVGSYSTSNSMYGVLVMFLSGVLGYVMVKCRYSYAPLLLAFVLAPMLESNMRKAFIISRGDVGIFFQKPISLAFIIALLLIATFPIFRPLLVRAGILKGKKAP